MKYIVFLIALTVAGDTTAAQQTPGAGGPATTVATPAMAVAATNAFRGGPNPKLAPLINELGPILKELHPHEAKLQESDPDVKALTEKKIAAEKIVLEIENQRRELLDRKLSADPKLAALVARRRELQQELKDAQAPASPVVPARQNRAGFGTRPAAPSEGSDVLRPAPAPAAVPAAEKPAAPPE